MAITTIKYTHSNSFYEEKKTDTITFGHNCQIFQISGTNIRLKYALTTKHIFPPLFRNPLLQRHIQICVRKY